MSVDVEQRGPFAVVKINRPEARNAVNGDVAHGIEAAIDQIEADDGTWVGTSGRGRVLVYNTDLVDEGDLPGSIFDLTDLRWKGVIGLPPTNSSFQAHVAAMIEVYGEDESRAWLDGLARRCVGRFAMGRAL